MVTHLTVSFQDRICHVKIALVLEMPFHRRLREEMLMPSKNALETAAALGEFGNPFKGERFMRMETLRWLFEQLKENGIRLLLENFGHRLTTEDIAYIAERLRELCFLSEEFDRWRERMKWLNSALQRLNLTHLQYPMPD
ncbi:hypothetical protein Q2T83_15020 [Fervidibacter sacchari]|uniref:Uncharacterized protein n=1 Tax=Candidatus Fervidibacter sacchari TaxID=1448929 RepID=A0ABT2EIU4_9BACT|nr:hypothetical protein [Candidatus Fervidibacter sacchari]MCS3917811.1 hypothetical protein [Candidatus Fervidibacter sacchari]WKU15632.1 hypothetical protein Q2T83_15020 [Candidatus Fervidibacter sacchari]